MPRYVCLLFALVSACATPLARPASTAAVPLAPLTRASEARLGPPIEAGFGRRHIDDPTLSASPSEPLSGARTAER